jgi:hypothetical protein
MVTSSTWPTALMISSRVSRVIAFHSCASRAASMGANIVNRRATVRVPRAARSDGSIANFKRISAIADLSRAG